MIAYYANERAIHEVVLLLHQKVEHEPQKQDNGT